ncbi:MAG: DUF4190 domain-containing protein [Bacteroidota bacterium]
MEIINPTGTQICTRCGYHNDERAFFCSQCGAPLGKHAGRERRYHESAESDSYRRPTNDLLPLASLLCTIFGFFVAGPFGPLVGVILAHVSLRRMRQSGDDHNRGLAIASLIIGYIILLLGLVVLILFGTFIGMALFNGGEIPWNWHCM